MPTQSKLNNVIQRAEAMFTKGVDKILSSPEDTYIKSMVDPFHPDASGTRVPSLNPVDTWTHSQFDTVSVNVAQYS